MISRRSTEWISELNCTPFARLRKYIFLKRCSFFFLQQPFLSLVETPFLQNWHERVYSTIPWTPGLAVLRNLLWLVIDCKDPRPFHVYCKDREHFLGVYESFWTYFIRVLWRKMLYCGLFLSFGFKRFHYYYFMQNPWFNLSFSMLQWQRNISAEGGGVLVYYNEIRNPKSFSEPAYEVQNHPN